MAWARGSIREAVRALCYNHKHVCARNLDYRVRVTSWLSGFLTSVHVFVHYDLETKEVKKLVKAAAR